MTRKKDSANKLDWKPLMAGQEDLPWLPIPEVVQQVLGAVMDEAIGAANGERPARVRSAASRP